MLTQAQDTFATKQIMKRKQIAFFGGLYLPVARMKSLPSSFIAVHKTTDGKFFVEFDGVAYGNFVDFEDVMIELCMKFPWWIGCEQVSADVLYKPVIERFLKFCIGHWNDCVVRSYNFAFTNWRFEVRDEKEEISELQFLSHDAVLLAILDATHKNSLHNAMFRVDKTAKPQDAPASRVLDMLWDGYCPESRLKGKRVRMGFSGRFFESVETRLRISYGPDGMAIIMKKRGRGRFKENAHFADQQNFRGLLCPQTRKASPYNPGTRWFGSSSEIEEYIGGIEKIQ